MEEREPLTLSVEMQTGTDTMVLSHGRGIGIQDALKEDFRGLSRVASGLLASAPDL